MEEFPITSFKFGLDTRKDVLTGQPGTLVTCQNAVINTGGEVEKRKKFDQFKLLNILDDDGNQGVFGLEVTQDGLITFGSALPFGSTLIGNANYTKLVSAIPSGITYKLLAHPTVEHENTYNASKHRMTALVFSANFNGLFFAAARFSDGNVFLYYEGDSRAIITANGNYYRPILQSLAGLVYNTSFGAGVGAGEFLIEQVEALGWQIQTNVDESGALDGNGDFFLVDSPQANYFTAIATDTSTSGRVGIKTLGQDGTGNPGAKAVAGFRITVDSGTFTLQAPETVDNLANIELCGGAVASTGTAATTVALIAQKLNDLTNVHGYTALTQGDSLFVYAPASFGAVTFNLVVTVTTGTVTTAGAAPTALRAIINPTPLSVDLKLTRNRVATVVGEAKIEAAGGTSPYKFLWNEASSSGNGIVFKQFDMLTENENNTTATFSKELLPNAEIKGNFQCLVKDAVGATVIVFLTVSLRSSYRTGR